MWGSGFRPAFAAEGLLEDLTLRAMSPVVGLGIAGGDGAQQFGRMRWIRASAHEDVLVIWHLAVTKKRGPYGWRR